MPSSKPKLLLAVTSSAWGGAERYVSRLAAAARDEFDVTVLAGSSERFELFRSLPEGVRTIELPDLKRPISPWHDLLAVLHMRAIIDREGFDLVHANSSKTGLVASLAARLSRRKPKVVYTAHGWGFLEKRSPLFRWAILASERIAAPFREATIALSEAERDEALRRELSTPERLRVIPLGIDADEIEFLERDEARDALAKLCGTRLDRIVIGTIANAYPAKALPLLLGCFERLAEEFPDADLVVLGDGPGMPDLRALRDGLPHRDRICLPGAVQDAARYLKAFDLFVLASTKEGLPWTVLEASLAGLPIVVTRVGALPEIVEDGNTGLLVPPGDAAALERAIRSVLTDRDLLLRLKNGAPRIAERRSGSRMISETLDLYRSLTRRS